MSTQPPTSHFRLDLQGIRAIAVVCVVLFHAGIPFVPGGFIGVDVFFVLSGFFITGLIVRGAEKSRRVNFALFYSRRFMRLIPASSLVLAVTLLATLLWVNPLDRAATGWDGLFSACDISNFRFAFNATQYFVGDERANPFLHMWSLAVETQFYLLWPALIALVLLLSRRTLGLFRSRLVIALVTLTVASLALSIWLTPLNQPAAFFLLPTRAWELGVGGLLFLLPQLTPRFEWLRTVLFVAGIAGILASAALLNESVPFPGIAAVAPVLATALVIVANSASPLTRAISNPVGLALGRWSYSLYLWHWPILVFATLLLGRALSWRMGLALMVGATFLAWLTYRFIENPLRQREWKPARKFALAGTLTAVVAGLAVVAIVLPVGGGITEGKIPRLDPANLTNELQRGALIQRVPDDLVPALRTINDESTWPEIYRNGCRQTAEDAPMPPCEYGDLSSTHTVWLLGDSHAAQWFPALNELALAHHWKLVVRTKAGCSIGATTQNPGSRFGWYPACPPWQERMRELARAAHPDAVIIGSFADEIPTEAGLVSGLSQWAGIAPTVIFIGDNPGMSVRPAQCLEAHHNDVTSCLTSRADAVAGLARINLSRAAHRAGVKFIDSAPWFCAPDACPVIVNNVLLWRDAHHISWAGSLWLAPVIDQSLSTKIPGW